MMTTIWVRRTNRANKRQAFGLQLLFTIANQWKMAEKKNKQPHTAKLKTVKLTMTTVVVNINQDEQEGDVVKTMTSFTQTASHYNNIVRIYILVPLFRTHFSAQKTNKTKKKKKQTSRALTWAKNEEEEKWINVSKTILAFSSMVEVLLNEIK